LNSRDEKYGRAVSASGRRWRPWDKFPENAQENEMFKTIVIALAVAVIAFLAYVASRPSAFRIERSQIINAPPESLFALINDLHRFNSWNPFALADPSLQIVYSGPESGEGAAYEWHGTGKSGTGRMQISASTPPSRVTMQLEFMKPFAARNIAEFAITREGPATRVTWAMTGRNTYTQKLMSTVFDMDRMVGGEFAKGLSNLKALAERQ
jgi:hypothetical protein